MRTANFSSTCFVIAPIGSRGSERYQRFRNLLDFAIRPAVESANLGLEVVRADDIGGPGSLIRDILEHIAASHIVIADLSEQNPNVFYELGVRHSLSPRTILIAQKIEDIPFDLRDYRVLAYDAQSPEGLSAFIHGIKKYILQIHQNPARADSPVLDRLGASKLVRIPSADLASELRVPLDIRHAGLHRVYKSFPVDDVYRAISQATQRVFILTTWLDQGVRLAPALGAHQRGTSRFARARPNANPGSMSVYIQLSGSLSAAPVVARSQVATENRVALRRFVGHSAGARDSL
jgi:hypothetical protein